jgi:hypothetical protein
MLELGGGYVRKRFYRLPGLHNELPALLEDLNDRSNANRYQKRHDQSRNGPTKKRLDVQEASISGLGDRLGQPLDGI